MTIEFDNPENRLPPLKPHEPPAIPILEVLAVADVTLYTDRVPLKKFRDFYEKILGLTFVESTPDHFHFRHLTRDVFIQHRSTPLEEITAETAPQGKLLITVRHFNSALAELRNRSIPCELLHTESGLARLALLQDPGKNWIYLIELRPL